jgi:uncharacterized protein (UPF0548 family)
MTEGPAPESYRVSDRSVTVGSGRNDFERASAAVQAWTMLAFPWLIVYPDRPVPRPGLTVMVTARSYGIWTLNPARIVYLIDEDDRSGFAYGTVEGHAVTGEERFEVNIDDGGTVRYRITAYSQLRHPLARAAPPLARRTQKRFATESLQAMERALRAGE